MTAESSAIPCAQCGTLVDPLRAARVAHIGERFRYFCSAACRTSYDPAAHTTPIPVPDRQRGLLRPEHVVAVREDSGELQARRMTAAALAEVGSDALEALDAPAEPAPAIEPEEPAPVVVVPRQTDIASLLLALALLGGVLAVTLALAGNSAAALNARLTVVVVACVALAAQVITTARDPSEIPRSAILVGPVAASALALFARIATPGEAAGPTTVAGIIIACAAAGIWLMHRARLPLDALRTRIATALDCEGTRVVGDELMTVPADDLRPGEEIVVGPGEVVPVDATVSAGSATLSPWLDARTRITVREGEPVVAGATVHEGRIRAVVGWISLDRAWMRLTNDVRRRADLLASSARAGRLLAERGAPVAAGLAALTAFAQNHDPLTIALSAVAAQSALACAGLAQIGSLFVARATLAALDHGIAYRSAGALERAGRASATVFNARGTLLLGEPEVANVEPVGDAEAAQVLALVAGAESGAKNPVASAVLRAARDRGVRPDGVRSPTFHPGLGVTAVASSGEALVVGSRALMLKERISVARAEPKITDLEAMGRSVLLVALGGRLAGVIGLQDGLRPGARAAIQYLLDVGVEPILLSGDARETCEAWGRALDVEHVRPEVLPGDRADEIRRLADGGATVAVIGRSPVDEAALGAADVSIALAAAGSSSAEWSVQLASEDVREAALAVRFAHRCRTEARLGLALIGGPAILGALAVGFGLAGPALAPVASLAGTLAALARARSAADDPA